MTDFFTVNANVIRSGGVRSRFAGLTTIIAKTTASTAGTQQLPSPLPPTITATTFSTYRRQQSDDHGTSGTSTPKDVIALDAEFAWK